MQDEAQQKALTEPITSVPADAIHCISGLIYQVLRPGRSNDRPGSDDIVQVLLEARNDAAGHVFDSSGAKGGLRTFIVREAMAGLAEAFQLMTVGQKMRVWLPAHLAFDESHEAKGDTLIFDIEMVSFKRVKEPPSLLLELTSPYRKE